MSFSAALIELGFTDLKDLTQKEREILYSAGYALYQEGHYEKSAGLFTKLVLHFPYESRFWKGLASNRQMQKDYRAALQAWGVFALLSGHSPDAHYHAAECYLSLGEVDEAKKALSCAKIHLEKKDPMRIEVEKLQKQVHDG